ncbi:cationic amino acid transporter 3 [Ditylenchus destructor]|uniref:Cationic amino acid transporter 3 n=1 Tax=Ditylenchus destructor TaxID=166010 RepID=A0AAD4N129_9BILA|nr:cationic amino acid transporter 3 [Ditylenchus destructor]
MVNFVEYLGLGPLWAKCRRQKRLDAEGILHSEWNRRLGVCSVAAIAGTMALTFAYYVVLPKLFASFTARGSLPAAPPLVAFALTYLLIFLAGWQMASAAEQVPRSALLYKYAYYTNSEVMAFSIAWNQLMDWLAILALLLHTISDHFNLLFHNVVEDNLRMTWSKHEIVLEKVSSDSINMSPHFMDWFALTMLIIACAILCCSTRVLITITVIFLISALFTATSTTVVALLHNIAHLRVTYVDLSENFDELTSMMGYFLLGFLAVETLGFLADESEQPAKVLPSAVKCSVKINCLVTFVALISFFPFVYKISFDDNTVLPAVFNTISIFSARYLMNVGSICGLTATLFCAFVPPTRLVCALSKDDLLPFQSNDVNMSKLHGKGGSPRLAVVVVAFVVGLLIVLVPKIYLIHFIPLNVCLRFFVMAVLHFRSNFSSNQTSQLTNETKPPKYSRLRNNRTTADMVHSSSDMTPSATSQDMEESGSGYSSSAETDVHLMEQMWQLSQNTATKEVSENSGLLNQLSKQNGYASTSSNYNAISSQPIQIPKPHNCLISPCASAFQIPDGLHRSRLHIYDASSVSANLTMEASGAAIKSYHESGYSGEPFADSESTEKTANRFLGIFSVLAALVAISHRVLRETQEFVPILAVVSVISGIFLSLVIAFQLFRLNSGDEFEFTENNAGGCKSENVESPRKKKRWRVLGSLLSVFLLTQILFQFSLLKYALLSLWMIIGLILYISSIQSKSRLGG